MAGATRGRGGNKCTAPSRLPKPTATTTPMSSTIDLCSFLLGSATSLETGGLLLLKQPAVWGNRGEGPEVTGVAPAWAGRRCSVGSAVDGRTPA